MTTSAPLRIPYHRASLGEEEIQEVVSTLRSGWLTTGPKTKQFERDFAEYIGVKHAIALNSATAALHLALEAVGLKRGEGVLVPTMTFAATAEVVRYFDATPLLVDCQDSDLNIDVGHARLVIERALKRGEKVRAIIPVHYGGKAVDMAGIKELAEEFGLAVIEDAAHCCPAFYRSSVNEQWTSVGTESAVSCFSFYANKCITTGEGGMACTNDDVLAERMRVMSLHGISKDAWKRFTSDGSWYYEIIAPGFKYNLTDIASSIGLHQLKKADAFRVQREIIALDYIRQLDGISGLVLPATDENRIHSWHLFPIRLAETSFKIGRADVIAQLKQHGIGTSVHWMPLHLHPYYKETYGFKPTDLPAAFRVSSELISLPIYPGMAETDVLHVTTTLRRLLDESRRN